MPLDSVREIERAIDTLTPQQLEELFEWLEQYHPQPIDSKLQADLLDGQLDNRIQRASRLPLGQNATSLARWPNDPSHECYPRGR